MTTKSSRIRSLYSQGLSTREIACLVYETHEPTAAHRAYVRVVGRQRKGYGVSIAERNWRNSPQFRAYRARRFMERWHDEPGFKERHYEYRRRWLQNAGRAERISIAL